ncbi:hypothetical protein V8J88_17980 [Massilia sp. W12]|uniref:hypothetical protein n=1 Tax=Massilia sp. W12 TaxID=3126507 RepID=UPI0030D05417
MRAYTVFLYSYREDMMRYSTSHAAADSNVLAQESASLHPFHTPILTQFGDMVDVRKRGALRIMRSAGASNLDTPAVVRLWLDQQCRELNAEQARRLAAQLLAAADLADCQNRNC